MNLSIVVPIFDEPQDNIKKLYERILQLSRENDFSYEILFIDDGSKNNILDFLKWLHAQDKKVKVISFHKNYGQAHAFLAGFYFAKGDYIMTLDADMQYRPEEITRFIAKAQEGYDVIGGKRKKERRRLFSLLLPFYFKLFFGMEMVDHSCSFNMISRDIAQRILKNRAAICSRHLAYLWAKKKIEIDVTYDQRHAGHSRYSFLGYFCFGVRYLWHFSKRFQPEVDLCFEPEFILL